MIVFISGGAKNGKSTAAEDIAIRLSQNRKRYYVATMIPFDMEDRERIKRHRDSRKDKGFTTIEAPYDIYDKLKDIDRDGVYLIDSLTALLLNEMFKYEYDLNILEIKDKIVLDIKRLVDVSGSIVFVSDYIYSDSHLYDEYSEDYRMALGLISIELAKISDTVIECSTGNMIVHKGGLD